MKEILVEGNKTIKNFLIGQYPVTQKQFEKIMNFNPSYFKGKKLPVEQVTWYDAVMFCNIKSVKEKLQPCYDICVVEKNEFGNIIKAEVKECLDLNGYRLPISDEWEYAAKGGNKSKGYKYSGSGILDEVAWSYANSKNTTYEVGKKAPNELNIYDMTGNVWEWCWDLYNKYDARVLRGGSWYNGDGNCAVSYVGNLNPDDRNFNVGFRVCRLPFLGLIINKSNARINSTEFNCRVIISQ
jgi:formylglycine-generating enzyme required for sulfatase activity